MGSNFFVEVLHQIAGVFVQETIVHVDTNGLLAQEAYTDSCVVSLNSVLSLNTSAGVSLAIATALGDLLVYRKTMTGNETFIQGAWRTLRSFLDADGTARTYNPSGSFSNGIEVDIINEGDEPVTFDSAGIDVVVAAGQRGTFSHNGGVWRAVVI